MKKALLLVDLQNDFYEDGNLPVPGATEINTEINLLMKSSEYKVIIASQDWHPSNHKSFAINNNKKPYTPYNNGKGIGPLLWPVHCLQGTKGAGFHTDIKSEYFNYIIRKGTNHEVDSYSAFRENNGEQLGLAGLLRGLGINKIDIAGLALDYCVKYTALDAVKENFEVNLILSASRGVEAVKGDVDKALKEMEEMGIWFK
jgi:nicotinamidase/pyrazinamidase